MNVANLSITEKEALRGLYNSTLKESGIPMLPFTHMVCPALSDPRRHTYAKLMERGLLIPVTKISSAFRFPIGLAAVVRAIYAEGATEESIAAAVPEAIVEVR